MVKHIEAKYEEYQRADLEIGNPYFEPEYIGDEKGDSIKLSLVEEHKEAELFLFVHTMVALETEGYLEIEDFSYGATEIFDMYDRGFLFKVKLKKIETRNDIEAKNLIQMPIEKIKPLLLIQNGKGYLKFHKNGQKIPLGGINRRKFKLLQILMEPPETLGVAKNTEVVFEAIMLPKDKNNPKLKDNYLKQNQQISIIEYTIKEIQKIKKLQGKIRFVFYDNKRTLLVEFT